ncbi:MAG TPA: alanine--tRNA ligase [Candidatus Paceibacterota bacterium]
MTSNEIRKRFIEFFLKRGHIEIPSASLVPANDPSVLFNTAGMQPLMPYFFGKKHPDGDKLVNSQKCVRTVDIDEIGDNTHATFFEMLGNWSLGDYFKKEAINWSYEFLTSKTEGLGLDPMRLYVTCFAGDDRIPKDTDAVEIWKSFGIPENRIYFQGVDSNWWPAVKKEEDGWTGPTGTCSEMFYDVTEDGLGDLSPDQFRQADEEQKIVEIWNDVFMEYEKKDGEIVRKLPQKNVDTGAGFERLVAVVQKKKSIFDTDLFVPLIQHIRENPSIARVRSERIIADHIRTATFLIADGVSPSNTDRGYILRRLIRRAVRHADVLKLPENFLGTLVPIIEEIYKGVYPEITLKKAKILSELSLEEEKFRKTLVSGMRQFEKISKENITALEAFTLFSSYGFPVELTKEIAEERGLKVDEDGFKRELSRHQDLSRVGAEQKFKGGLFGTGEIETKYHTATHLLHQALRDVLGTSVEQKGSNITVERARFDFAFDRKMTDEEKKKVENIINEKIQAKLPVNKIIMKKADALKTGALHFFGDKYGDEVNVYYIGNSLTSAYSKEFCGGPHVENISVLGNFKILKEEAVSAGVRRIKAVLK